MARIKINDLQDDRTITKEELKQVMGGFNPQPEPPATRWRTRFSQQGQPGGQWATLSRFGFNVQR